MSPENPVARVHASLLFGALASVTACSSETAAPTGEAPGGGRSPSAESAAEVSAAAQQSAARLAAAYPQAKMQLRGERLRRLYGVAATGATADAAAESFRASSATAFGIQREDLAPDASSIGLLIDRATGKPKFRLYSYQQKHQGVNVFRKGFRMLVREGGNNPVVWANVDLQSMGSLGTQSQFQRRSFDAKAGSVDLAKSLAALRTDAAVTGGAIPVPSALEHVSAPKSTIFAGTEDRPEAPQQAIEYTAEAVDSPGKWTFVADATTGDVLYVESDVHFDVGGKVEAEVIAGSESQECGQLGVVPLQHARVRSPTGSAVTDASGAFSVPTSVGGPVDLVSDLTGKYFSVNDGWDPGHSLAATVTPPGPANFLHRDTEVPAERVLAQLNAYKAANDIRDFLLAHVPQYPDISTQTGFLVNVNLNSRDCEFTGGAWYNGESVPPGVNFCQRTETRANTAFRSIVHHEYGHHIVQAGRSEQGEYGEAMADAVAVLFAKDPNIGVGYHLNRCDAPLRNVVNQCQYLEEGCSTCGAGLYECAGVLSGTIWDLWQRLAVTELEDADTIVRDLVLNSIPLHTGTKIDPSIAIDLLTLDDDDALLENGTPHYAEICGAFADHGMLCPPLVGGLVFKGDGFVSEGPSDGPFVPASAGYDLYNLGPQQSLAYSVEVPADAPWLSVSSTGGSIALNQKVTITATIDQSEAARLPDGDYTAAIEFVNASTGASVASRDVKLRVGAPVPIYTADFASGLDGFTVGDEPENAWHPSTTCADSLPGHSSPGSLYYGRQDACHYAVSTPIFHTATSPVIAIANPATAELGFKYFLETENSPEYDRASVLLAVNGGEFELVASNNRGGLQLYETAAWQELRVDIASLLPSSGTATIQIQFAFDGVTIGNNTKTGFVVDDVTVYAKPSL